MTKKKLKAKTNTTAPASRKRTGGSALPMTTDVSGEHWRYCPQCGHELINEKCKLRCPRCHYFMSCSDFDFAS